MATITWPSDVQIGAVDFGIQFDVQMNIFRDGSIQTYGLPGGRWVAALTFEPETEFMKRPKIEALIVSLEGGANRLALPYFPRRVPNGTMRGSPTINANAAAGSKQVSIANANGTLKAGDIIGILGQSVMVMADVSPSGGVMAVDIKPALRNAVTVGVAVVWNSPTSLFIPRSATAGPFPYRPAKVRPGFSVELIEAY
jgi:hypothetical protein